MSDFNKQVQKQMDDMVRRITREIEHEMFYGIATPQEKLKSFLFKLGVKSAKPGFTWFSDARL